MAHTFEYAIVGGGAAAATAAEAIRGRDPAGSTAIFTREWAPPYQRPPPVQGVPAESRSTFRCLDVSSLLVS